MPNVNAVEPAVKNPSDWASGDERMTSAQASYLRSLCEQAGEKFNSSLTKAEASNAIERLRSRTR